MLVQNILLTTAVGAAAAYSHERRQDSDDDLSWSSTDVIGAPSTITAGEETTLRFNWTHRVNRQLFGGQGELGGDYRKVQLLVARYIEESVAQIWCVLEPCILPNVTSIKTIIPEDAFEDGEYVFRARAYDMEGLDDPDTFNYTLMVSDHLDFDIEGGKGEDTEWEDEHGWEILGPGLWGLSCDKVPCVRSCIEEHLSVDDGSSQSSQDNIDDFQECAEECGVSDTDDPRKLNGTCIATNAGSSDSGSGGSGSSGPGSGGDNDDDDDDSDGSEDSNDDNDDDDDAASRLGGVSTAVLVGGLAAWALIAM